MKGYRFRSTLRSAAKEMVTVSGTVIRTSEKALCLEFRRLPDSPYCKLETKWIPRSVVSGGKLVVAEAQSIAVQRWFAEDNGLPIIGLAPTNES